MPTLPSGRRIEFSLDRFHKLLRTMGNQQAREIAENIEDSDDLLFVLDAVHFSLADNSPYFAGYVAADWKDYAADWSNPDRHALQVWLVSEDARCSRAEAIQYIKSLLLDYPGQSKPYPYVLTRDIRHPGACEGSRLRQ